MKKIITVVGARPQFIKAASLSRQFKRFDIEEKIIHTGQHFDKNMSSVFFDEMEIPSPAYQLDIHSLPHGAMTGRMLEDIEQILTGEKPDYLLVYGDTNSTLAGALAASKLQIPIIHIEAGLRSFNTAMPEEINRIVTDRLSSYLFCPTETAVKNLLNEGFGNFPAKIIKNGDVMQDAAIFYAQKAEEKSKIVQELHLDKYVLATIHRQENTDNLDRLAQIIQGLNEIHKNIQLIVPLHPRTKKLIAQMNIRTDFQIIDPVGYFDMIMLLKKSCLVITDSGGVQKEAFFFKKHCITLREETEWTELLEHGFNTLIGADAVKMTEAFNELIGKQSDFSIDLYGNGRAAEIAADYISKI